MKKNQISLKDMKEMEKTHPAIPEAYEKLVQGRISRRDFLRFSTLLGMSAGTAYFLAACGAPQPAAAPAETAAPAASITRGGTWTSSMQLQLLDHPARLSWVEGANIVRQICEYLTLTGVDNITRPYLLDKWEASEDVTDVGSLLEKGHQVQQRR